MNKDQVVGRLDQAVGNESLQADGLAEQAGGKITSSFSDTKESLKNKAKDVIDKL